MSSNRGADTSATGNAASSSTAVERTAGSRDPLDIDIAASARLLLVELAARGASVAVAESLTGGLVMARLIDVPGASAQVRGGVVAYATDLKRDLLGVDAALLSRVGPVDLRVAEQMARGVAARLGASLGLATTGVAGPDAADGKVPGTVCIAAALAEGPAVSELHHFLGARAEVRGAAVGAVLHLGVRVLAGGEHLAETSR